MRKRVLTSMLALAFMAGPATGDAELILRDGRVLAGQSVRRDEGNYVLRMYDDQELVLPEELVQSVRLMEPEPAAPALVHSKPMNLAVAPPPGPSGLVDSRPLQIEGPPARLPTTREQTAVLGPPATFQKDIIDPRWVPTSDWDMSPSNNNFAPSTWQKSIIDPSWEPTSSLQTGPDVPERSRSTFRKSIIDSSWEPTDGFSK